MTGIDEALDGVLDRATDLLNAEGRHPRHVAVGLALTVGFALAATLFARRAARPVHTPDHGQSGDARLIERPRGAFSLILPAVFSATTLSAVRVWNAPHRRERTLALGLWAGAQALNAVWIAMRPASRQLQIAAAMSSAGLAAAFAHEARKLDVGAGKLASPTGGGVRLGNMLDRKAGTEVRTVH
jgi:hypothetical protein